MKTLIVIFIVLFVTVSSSYEMFDCTENCLNGGQKLTHYAGRHVSRECYCMCLGTGFYGKFCEKLCAPPPYNENTQTGCILVY
jgi:hypothetical protein